MRQKNIIICRHHNLLYALGHPSLWAGVAGVLSTVGTQLDKPYSIACFIVSGVCSVVAILIRTPHESEIITAAKKDGTWEQ